MARSRDRQEDQERDIVRHIAGNVGRDPEEFTAGERDLVGFSVAVTRTYPDRENDQDDGETRWYSVSVSKPALQDWVLDNIHKGTIVIVEGFPWERESDGRTYHNINAARIGLIEWGGSSARQEREEKRESRRRPAGGERSTRRSTRDRDDW